RPWPRSPTRVRGTRPAGTSRSRCTRCSRTSSNQPPSIQSLPPLGGRGRFVFSGVDFMSPRGPMPGYDEITKETLEAVLKSVTNQGYTTDLNLTGINLRGPALNLFPFLSPYRNRLPREMAPVGAKASQWRAITGINVTNQSIFSG